MFSDKDDLWSKLLKERPDYSMLYIMHKQALVHRRVAVCSWLVSFLCLHPCLDCRRWTHKQTRSDHSLCLCAWPSTAGVCAAMRIRIKYCRMVERSSKQRTSGIGHVFWPCVCVTLYTSQYAVCRLVYVECSCLLSCERVAQTTTKARHCRRLQTNAFEDYVDFPDSDWKVHTTRAPFTKMFPSICTHIITCVDACESRVWMQNALQTFIISTLHVICVCMFPPNTQINTNPHTSVPAGGNIISARRACLRVRVCFIMRVFFV